MNTKRERFFSFIKKEGTRSCLAFVFYVLVIVRLMQRNLPEVLVNICFIVQMFIILFSCAIYMPGWIKKIFERNREKMGKNIIQSIKKCIKEIGMFIPVWLIANFIITFVAIGEPANDTDIATSFYNAPILNSMLLIVIGPIIEEFIFRFLPYKFIKNKTLYIIVSSFIFAAMHVRNDQYAFYYIWFYMMTFLYYAYRYHKTKDIWVTISIHSFNNLIATLLFILLDS